MRSARDAAERSAAALMPRRMMLLQMRMPLLLAASLRRHSDALDT
jgi:hypothetical protein